MVVSLELPVHLLEQEVICDGADCEAGLVHDGDNPLVWLI